MKSLESKLAVLAFVSLVAGWIAGTTRSQAEIKPHLKTALPEAERFLHLGDDAYAGIKGKAEKTEDVGYVAVGEASGYGGPLRIAVGLDLDGRLVGISVIEHRESAPYYMKIQRRGFPESFVGKNHSDPFSPGEDIDTVSGASSTLQGLADAARKAIRKIASRESTLSLPPEKRTPQRFGFPEITLLLLFGMGLWMYRTKTEKKSIARWGLLIAGFVLIGFLYTIPFSLTHVHALLLGYWPPWITHLFWYILVAGVFLSVILMGKSPYCDGFCPFRATQEILALIGGARIRVPAHLSRFLRWVQRLLAWGAILLALALRHPTITSYEVFPTFFDLIGSEFQFALLAVVLLLSLVIKRPWCNVLCPIRAVVDYLTFLRKKALALLRGT